jgi:hypothetical protein
VQNPEEMSDQEHDEYLLSLWDDIDHDEWKVGLYDQSEGAK